MASMPPAPIDLRTERRIDPMGLGAEAPRFGWRLADDRRGARQTAYQIVAEGDLAWDSGRVEGDASQFVEWRGPAPRSRARVSWRVRVWDQDGAASDWSAPAHFEFGLLERSDWSAQWIGAPLAGTREVPVPAPLLRRTFHLKERPVKARLFMTALGLVEPWLNGAPATDAVFFPGWTDYAQRVQFGAEDVTGLLREGENVLAAMLGDGWYCGRIANKPRQNYGGRPAMLLQLEMTFADGRTEVLTTNDEWRTAPGPVLANDLIDGEVYDARQAQAGWNAPGFEDAGWMRAVVLPDPGIELSPMLGGPVRRQEELSPVTDPRNVGTEQEPIWQFDLGQNMVGWVRIRVRGEAGDEVRLRFAEMLDNGRLYLTALRGAKATDTYVLRGGEVEEWEPRFTFHGFRYVEVSGLRGTPDRGTVTGVVVHSEIPKTGAFNCSEPLLERFALNVDWGQRGNFVDVPTDCPQRDERLGWTGDAQVFARAACFNRDVLGFMHKWVRDLVDAQLPDGGIPPVVPNPPGHAFGLAEGAGPAWEDAATILPWTVYRCTGDRRILERVYPALRRWIPYLESTAQDLVRCGPDFGRFKGFGDWLSINADTPQDVIGTAYFAHSARLGARIAALLGETADAEAWNALADRVRDKFRSAYITPEGDVVGRTQTAYVLALVFDLAPENLRPAIARRLVEDIRRRGNHLSTGFVGGPLLCWALSENGHADVAWDLIQQRTWPSWLYPVTVGATTIWERWDGWTADKGFQDPGMNSFNHYAYGSALDWLTSQAAGLDLDPEVPGYRRLRIAPIPGGGLDHASAHLDTPYGPARSAWRIGEGLFTLEVTVPANTEAEVWVPFPGATGDGLIGESRGNRTRFTVAAGTYRLTAPLLAPETGGALG